jgi:hypothetical protein
LLVVFLLHYSKDFLALLALLYALLMLILDHSQLSVNLVKLLLHGLLLAHFVAHFDVIGVDIFTVETIVLSVLVSQLHLVCLILLLNHVEVSFSDIDLLFELLDLFLVLVLKSVLLLAEFRVKLADLFGFVLHLLSVLGSERVDFGLALSTLLLRFLFIFLEVLFLLVTNLSKFLGA